MRRGETLTAALTIDGAWLNTATRMLFTPPDDVTRLLEALPMHEAVQER